jgi:DNA-binding NarL/FixJ family response regulator
LSRTAEANVGLDLAAIEVRRFVMIRVAVAEEQRIPRWALAEALGKTADLEIVGQAGTVEDTLDMVRKVKPEVLVVDTTIPDHSGFDVLAQLRDFAVGPLVVVLAPFTEPAYAARAIGAGAHGYVAKSAAPEELIKAIRTVTRGEQVSPPGVDKLLAAGDGHLASALTARETQVMEMLARGMTNREIAHDLDISINTVDTHRGHVLKKLALRNNAELARFAVKHGYVTL